MKRTLTLYLLLSLLLLTGCNDPKHVTDALTRAEALMNEHPDSAWTVLNAISPDEMGQNRNRAHYALLYTQAQDKTYQNQKLSHFIPAFLSAPLPLPVTFDSTIRVVTATIIRVDKA